MHCSFRRSLSLGMVQMSCGVTPPMLHQYTSESTLMFQYLSYLPLILISYILASSV